MERFSVYLEHNKMGHNNIVINMQQFQIKLFRDK